MEVREVKALELFDRGRVVKDRVGYMVFSLNSAEKYRVLLDGHRPTCTCPDWELRQEDCKHILACRIARSREGGSTVVIPPETLTSPVQWPKPTYKQDWPRYDRAQQCEKREVQRLLAELCGTVPTPPPANPKKGGRPQAPLSDVIFASVFKVYSGFSGRRFATDQDAAMERGHISQSVHHSTIARCLEDAQTTPVLIQLIEASALPFKALEDEFAVDSTAFSACKFDRWYEEKWGQMRSAHPWIKVHVMTGTSTHVVTAVIIDDKESADYPQFATLLKTTAANFTVRQVVGDKAYTGEENFQAVDAAGGTAYLAFKVNATGHSGGLFEKMFHLFCLNKDDYLKHYHRRSNVESTFSAIKRLMGDSVRSKNETAMRNEVLAKILAYNLTLLVHAIYELGLEPVLDSKEEATVGDERAVLKFPGVG